jgi:hypothetical protein
MTVTATVASVALAGLLAAEAPAPPAATGDATEGEQLAVRTPLCQADVFSFPAFVDLLRVELTGTPLRCCDVVEEARWPPAPPVVRVDVSVDPCDAKGAVVWLRVDDPARRSGAHRGVPITNLDIATRSRALALVVAELLRSSERDVESNRGAPAVVAGVRARLDPPDEPDAQERRVPVLEGGGELRGYPSRGLVLRGARLGFLSRVGERLVVGGDAGVLAGDRSYDIGAVHLRSATLGLALGPRWSLGRAVTVTAGARGEVGWAELRGEASDPSLISNASRSTAVVGAGAFAALEAPARTTLRARLLAQGGTMIRGLAADVAGTSTAGMSGPFWSVGLGLVLAPWK